MQIRTVSKFLSILVVATVLVSCTKKDKTEILVPEEKGPKWGFIDHSGKFVIKPKFHRVKGFSQGLAGADLHARWGFIDRDGKFAIKRQFEDVKTFHAGYAPVSKNGKWGAINTEGVVVMPIKYADVGRASEVDPDAEDHAVLMPYKYKDQGWGFKDFGPHGKGDIEPQFEVVKWFNDGLCPVQKTVHNNITGVTNIRWGYCNNTGEVVIPYKFDRASVFKNRVAECYMGDDFVWVDQIGTIAKKPRLESTQLFHDGRALQQRKGKFVFINRKGKRAFRKRFKYADNFSEGLAVVQTRRSIKRGYIDTRGELVIPQIYDDARAFSEQLAAVRVDPDVFFKEYNEDGTAKKPKESDKDKDKDKDKGKDKDKDKDKDKGGKKSGEDTADGGKKKSSEAGKDEGKKSDKKKDSGEDSDKSKDKKGEAGKKSDDESSSDKDKSDKKSAKKPDKSSAKDKSENGDKKSKKDEKSDD